MGWVKAELDERTHERLRQRSKEREEPIDVVAAELIAAGLNGSGQ